MHFRLAQLSLILIPGVLPGNIAALQAASHFKQNLATSWNVQYVETGAPLVLLFTIYVDFKL
jgi:hypothetical protein